MKKISFTKISFYFSIAILSCFVLMFLLITIFPSPAVCEGLADLFTIVGGIIGVLGFSFAIAGIKEPNSIKKWIGIIVNAIMAFVLIQDLLISNAIR